MKKCINKRCKHNLDDDFKFCPYCGKSQSKLPQKESKRPNGTGSIYFRKDNKTNPYAASSSITGARVYIGSFPTKTAALRALQEYEYNPVTSFNITLEQLHMEWQTVAYKNLGKSVQENYSIKHIKNKYCFDEICSLNLFLRCALITLFSTKATALPVKAGKAAYIREYDFKAWI